jgi:hypothetical protein
MRSRRVPAWSYLLAVVASPVLLIVGDPLARLVRDLVLGPRVPGARHVSGRRARVLSFFHNPLVIALTAPSRWAADRLRPLFGPRRP